MIELYHDWDSLMSFKVRVCLAEKGLEWKSRIVKLTKFQHLEKSYLALNPNGVVPTLVHDDSAIIESSVINEYLNEAFPEPPLLPTEPLERARARAWVKYGDDVLHHGVRPATFELMIKTRLHGYSAQELERLIANHPQPSRAAAFRKAAAEDVDLAQVGETVRTANSAFERMEKSLGDNRWLTGEQLTLADLMAMSFLDRIVHLGLGFLIDERPVVREWADRLMTRESFHLGAPPEGTRLPAPPADLIKKFPGMFGCQGE